MEQQIYLFKIDSFAYKEMIDSMELSSYIPASPMQPCNPTDEQRHNLVKTALERNKRPEDFDYFKKINCLLTSPGGPCQEAC